jgi:L-rhamnose-H+ transport protein
MSAEITAFLLLSVSGLFQAAFAIPIKHLRNWRWEQVWVAQSVMANILLPLVWAAVAPGVFWEQASRVPLSHWLAAYAWGLVWGLGGVTYGLTLTRLGMGFANSFVFGVTIVTGALMPLALNVVASPPHPLRFGAGLVLCVVATGLIGLFRGRGSQTPMLATPASLRSYRCMVPIAIVSGFASAGYGLAFSFSFGTIHRLIDRGVSPLSAPLVVVLPVYLGGASVAVPVGLFFAKRSRTMALFVGRHAAWNWLLAVVMGLCAAATVVLYGLGGTIAGHPAPNVSFGIFMTFLVLGGNALGFATGEMRGNRPAVNAGLWMSSCGLVLAAWLLNAG